MFNAEGEVWRPQRKLAVAALAQRNVHRLFPSIQIVAGRLKTRWERSASVGETLDMVEELKRFTVDITMLIVFGHDANTVEQQNDFIQGELGVILPAINRRLFALVPTWRYVQTLSDRRLNRAFVNVRAWLDGLLAEARTRLKTVPERAQKPSNFLEAMVTTRDENGKPFSDDVIMSNLLTMLIGGEDTTTFTLGWAIHQLCDSPQWAAEIRREADAILGASISRAAMKLRAGSSALARSPAKRCVCARWSPISFHDANVDTSLGGYVVPKQNDGRGLFRPAAIDPANFVDPLAFRPERWLED